MATHVKISEIKLNVRDLVKAIKHYESLERDEENRKSADDMYEVYNVATFGWESRDHVAEGQKRADEIGVQLARQLIAEMTSVGAEGYAAIAGVTILTRILIEACAENQMAARFVNFLLEDVKSAAKAGVIASIVRDEMRKRGIEPKDL